MGEEGGGGRMGRSEGGIGRMMVMVEHRWKKKTFQIGQMMKMSALMTWFSSFGPYFLTSVSLRKENLFVGFKGH